MFGIKQIYFKITAPITFFTHTLQITLPPDDYLIGPGAYPRGHWEKNASCVEQLNPGRVLSRADYLSFDTFSGSYFKLIIAHKARFQQWSNANMIISVTSSPWWDCMLRLLREEEEEPGPGPWIMLPWEEGVEWL